MAVSDLMAARGITVVIVTYNSASCILRCLQAVFASTSVNDLQVIVVDNASSDNTLSLVKESYSEVQIIENRSNLGFAVACNQGLALVQSPYAMLLNPDAFLYNDTIENLVSYLEATPQAGIVGPRLVDEQGMLPRDSSVTGIFPGFCQALFEYTLIRKLAPQSRLIGEYLMPNWDRGTSQPVATVQGACFMFRSELLKELNGLDEQFFLYFEETDFCARAAALGWETHYAAKASCQHQGGHSMPDGKQHTKEFFRSFYLYHKKHSGSAQAILLRLILTISFLLEYALIRIASLFLSRSGPLERGLRAARTRLVFHLGLLR